MSCVTWLPKSRMRTRSCSRFVMGLARFRWVGGWVGGRQPARRRIGAALQHSDEEPVGAVPRRREAQHVAACRALAAHRLAPDLADRQEREIGMAGEEGFDLR